MFQGNFFFLQGKRLKLIMFRIVSKTERKKTSLSGYGSRDEGRTDTCVHEYFCDVCGSVRAGSKAIGFLEWIWSVSKNRLYLRRRIRAWPKASVNQWHSYFSCNSRSAHFAEVRSKKRNNWHGGRRLLPDFFFAGQDRGAVLTENTAYKTKQS